MSFQRSVAVWTLALPLYLCVSLAGIERHFGRHPYVFATVMIVVSIACWFGSINRRPRVLISTALGAPLLGAVAGYWVVLLFYWLELGHLYPPIDIGLGTAASFMAIGQSKALVLSLLLLAGVLWAAKSPTRMLSR